MVRKQVDFVEQHCKGKGLTIFFDLTNYIDQFQVRKIWEPPTNLHSFNFKICRNFILLWVLFSAFKLHNLKMEILSNTDNLNECVLKAITCITLEITNNARAMKLFYITLRKIFQQSRFRNNWCYFKQFRERSFL